MKFTSLSLIIFSFIALTIFIHVRRGYKKGLSTSLTGLCVVISSAIFGALLSMLLASLLADFITGLISDMDFYEDISETMMGLENALAILVKMVLSLVMFIPCFFILRLLISIPIKIILAKAAAKRDGNVNFHGENEEEYVKRNKTIAALIGALTGFIVSIVCQSLIVGVTMTVTGAVDFIETAAGEEVFDEETKETLDRLGDDFSVICVSACGGKMVFNFATSTFIDGELVCLNDELEAIYAIDINEFSELLEFNSTADENAERIASLVGKINESKIMKVAFVDTLKGLAGAWLENKEYMGVSRPTLADDSAINDVVDQLLLICQTTTSEYIIADVTTLVNISSIISDNRAVFSEGSYEDIVNTMTANNVIDNVKEELAKNPRMAKVSTALDDVVMQIVAEEITDFKYTDEQRDIFYDEVASILSSTGHLSGTTRVTKVTEQIEKAFSDYGVHVPEELNEQIATKLIDGLGTDVTYDDVYDYFESLISGEGGGLPPILGE